MDMDHYEERPVLDDFDLQSIQYELEVAYERKYEAIVRSWKDGKVMTRGGIIEVLDLRSERIRVSNILGVQCAE